MINGSLMEEITEVSKSVSSAENLTINSDSLSENVVYSFRIRVTNTIGVVSTRDRQFCKPFFFGLLLTKAIILRTDTTDVQAVTVAQIQGANMSTIQCDFITGTDAIGCMVVLTNEGEETIYNLTRIGNMNCSILTLDHPLSYTGVVGFDIEGDGSVDSLAIPGKFESNPQHQCIPFVMSSGIKNYSTAYKPIINNNIILIQAHRGQIIRFYICGLHWV